MTERTLFLERTGLARLLPLIRLSTSTNIEQQLRKVIRQVGVPVLAMLLFLASWNALAAKIETSLGTLPGPVQVWQAFKDLLAEHYHERARAQAFYERQHKRNAEILAADPHTQVSIRPWTGKPTYFDQILTSLLTVFTGFLLASIIAIPLGIFCGLSQTVQLALNPLIQLFKPVSPLAWLPIVTLIVSAVYVSPDPIFQKSFLISAITVMLCSLWPTLINTAVGVSNIDKDLLNVSKVLQLDWLTKLRKIVLPSALRYIFTGLRLSLGVGWMVLIASEMLAQNPGLGKFVWDEFQNGSSASLGRIIVAIFTIGSIGFLLDRIMQTLQQLASYEHAV